MSQSYPNDPFASGWPPASPMPPAPPRSSAGKVLLIIFGVLGGSALLCCGICGGLGVWGLNVAFTEDAQKLTARFKDHPRVKAELGGIDHCQVNYGQSFTADQETNIFDVRGPKGSGQFLVEDGEDDFRSVKLQTTKGQWELIDDAAPDSDPVDRDAGFRPDDV